MVTDFEGLVKGMSREASALSDRSCWLLGDDKGGGARGDMSIAA